MPYLRLYSDIHEDFNQKKLAKAASVDKIWMPPSLPTDNQTVLMLAGDLWNGTKSLRFMGQPSMLPKLAKRFLAVVLVLGNHDIWGASLPDFPAKFEQSITAAGLDNVFLLDALSSSVSTTIDGLTFIGSTLWTNISSNPLACVEFDTAKGMDGRSVWNDKNNIRVKENGAFKRLNARHWASLHLKSFNAISNAIKQRHDTAIVLLTHHAPLRNSLDPRNQPSLDDALYASNHEDLLFDYSDKLICAAHGHIHHAADYMAGNCRVLCNPLGYPFDPAPGFDPLGILLEYKNGILSAPIDTKKFRPF